MHMLLILLTLCLRKPDGTSRLFSIAYAFAGNGCTFEENMMMVFDLDVETPKIQGDIDRLLRENEQQTLRQSLELDQQERELAHQTRMEAISRELQLANAETDALKGKLVLAELARALQQNLAQVENRERIEE